VRESAQAAADAATAPFQQQKSGEPCH